MTQQDSQKGKNISVSISDPGLMAKIEKLSAKIKITPRQFIKNSIEIGIEEMTILDNIGFIRATLIMKNLREQLKAALNNKEPEAETNAEEKLKPFTIWLSHDVIEQLDYFQNKLSIKSRSELIAELVKLNLRDLFYFEKSGILNMSIFLRDLWRKRFKETQEAVDKGEIKIDLK